MNPEEIKQIVRKEIENVFQEFLGVDRYKFQKPLQIFDGRNVQLGKTSGTQIGTETTQKLAFYGVTPVDQPAAISAPTGQANDLDTEARTAINTIRARLQELGLTA